MVNDLKWSFDLVKYVDGSTTWGILSHDSQSHDIPSTVSISKQHETKRFEDEGVACELLCLFSFLSINSD